MTKLSESRSLLPLRYWLQLVGCCVIAIASRAALAQSPAITDLLRREFVTKEFAVKSSGPIRWIGKGEFYTAVEPSEKGEGLRDIVRYETATARREVLVSASQLIPSGGDKPLEIENYSFSDDLNRVLIFTNSRRVWRANTRGDYWVFDRKTGALRKLGDGGPPSSLMFAKFSPDGSKVAYVRFNNIYVEDLQNGVATRLTSDGSEKIVNGTTDWVSEEEFFLRDAFRWSPDGKRIAYWQFDTHEVSNFALIYDTGAPYKVMTGIPYPEFGVYPTVRQIPYPQPGTANSSVRVGVVPALGGETQWMQVPGYSKDHYIARMEWAGNSDTLVLQHLDRLQQTNDVLLADARTGAVHSIHQEHDSAWVDVVDDLSWLHGGKEFLWVSEQDGWRHVYVISRDGKQVRLVTPGSFDVIQVVGVDPEEQWLHFMASPENATQQYLYRMRIDGKGTLERLTPATSQERIITMYHPTCIWHFTLTRLSIRPRSRTSSSFQTTRYSELLKTTQNCDLR